MISWRIRSYDIISHGFHVILFPKQVYPVGVLAVHQRPVEPAPVAGRFCALVLYVFLQCLSVRGSPLCSEMGVTRTFACVLSVKMALVPSKPHLAPSRQPISKMIQKTLFPRIVRGPLGCHLLSSLVPKSRFRGSGKKVFPRCKMTFKMMQNYPLSIFHAAVRPESLPGADLSTF